MSKISSEKKCNGYYDQNTSSWNTYDCGYWYTFLLKKYWGRLDGKDYLSEGSDFLAVSPAMYEDINEVVKRKKIAIGSVCIGFCQNPLNMQAMIYEVK